MIESFKGVSPVIAKSAYVHDTSVLIGKVKLAENVSIWPLAVLRGDVDEIVVGANSNIQDLVAVHVNFDTPAIIGENVTVGHSAVIHGAKIGNGCLIGMNALVMESEIGDECLIAGGTVIAPGKKIPPRSLVMGAPGKIIKTLTADEVKSLIKNNTDYYIELARHYKGELK
ncbi:MAG TPA: gamma carbonic anhydrase family protein [Elusimicrobiales bacterium]|nr:gamma carbonic anhydrase family protein [Elusimicrobiales bacterium]